jgi:hypothetical protein
LLPRDDFEQDIAVAPFAERAPNPSRCPAQAPHFPRTRLGEKRAEGLLQASAPNAHIMDGFRIRVGTYFRRQRDKLLDSFAQ